MSTLPSSIITTTGTTTNNNNYDSHMNQDEKLKNITKSQLIDLLDEFRGKKTLIIEKELSAPTSLTIEFSILKEHGVDKVYYLQPDQIIDLSASSSISSSSSIMPQQDNLTTGLGNMNQNNNQIIFLCRPKALYMKWIANQVKARPNYQYCVFFVPKKSIICEKILEEENVLQNISFRGFHLDLVNLDPDVFSMEMNTAFYDLFVEKDDSILFNLSKILIKFQIVHGQIPRILGKGNHSKKLCDLLTRMQKEYISDTKASGDNLDAFPTYPEYDAMVILDRNVDLSSLLITPLTYEGLLDEFYGISTGFVELDPQIAGGSSFVASPSSSSTMNESPTKKKQILLNESDRIFAQVRNINFAQVGSQLHQMAKRLQDGFEARHQAKTVRAMKSFIGKLGDLQSDQKNLKIHVALAEKLAQSTKVYSFSQKIEMEQNLIAGIIPQNITEYLEDLIGEEKSLAQVLRILCMYSVAQGGLKQKQFDYFKREVIQTYGAQHLITLDRLTQLGLFIVQNNITSSAAKNNSAFLRKYLKLFDEECFEGTSSGQQQQQDEEDMYDVYTGYNPISVKLIQAVTKNHVKRLSSSYNNTTADRTNTVLTWKKWEDALHLLPGESFEKLQPVSFWRAKSNKRILVVFVGGCTFGEIASIRRLSLSDEGRDSYTILTTNIMNGNICIEKLIP